jgi:hypothetical protein
MEKETERGWRDPQIVNLFFELHGSVISRIDEFSLAQEGGFEAMRGALASLNGALCAQDFNWTDFPDFSASGRTSFPPPQSEPPSGSPWAAKGRWRTG